ncbi:MAG: FliA/WhiG family RNA polymerase sigma factor [Nitrospiraceae bacterium]|nr:FliA/WhiG family RNA polymerase sigma factor [Nitrospiraceae bacterium]
MAVSNLGRNIFSKNRKKRAKISKIAVKDYTDLFFSKGKAITAERRKELILKYQPLIRYIAGKLAIRLPPNVSTDDLMSSGVIGLMDAIEKFDPTKKIRFKTYAEFRIRGAMLDELRSLDWVPRSIRKKSTELAKTYQCLEKKFGRPAEDREVAEAMGLSMEEFYKLLDKTKNITFLDIDMIRRNTQDKNNKDPFDLVAGGSNIDPFSMLNKNEVKKILAEAITALPEKEKLVVSLYYYEDLTMREIGEVMGYTESRISQVHTKAMLRLRGHLNPVMEEITHNPV